MSLGSDGVHGGMMEEARRRSFADGGRSLIKDLVILGKDDEHQKAKRSVGSIIDRIAIISINGRSGSI